MTFRSLFNNRSSAGSSVVKIGSINLSILSYKDRSKEKARYDVVYRINPTDLDAAGFKSGDHVDVEISDELRVGRIVSPTNRARRLTGKTTVVLKHCWKPFDPCTLSPVDCPIVETPEGETQGLYFTLPDAVMFEETNMVEAAKKVQAFRPVGTL